MNFKEYLNEDMSNENFKFKTAGSYIIYKMLSEDIDKSKREKMAKLYLNDLKGLDINESIEKL